MSIAELPTRTLWPHQQRAIDETLAAIDAGETAICLTSPTGGGKSLVAEELALARDCNVAIYTNRRLMVEQLSRGCERRGIAHGIRAAGHEPALLRNVQICSMQTERQRVYGTGRWELHDAQLVIVDEAHLQKESTAQQIITDHRQAGAAVVGLTATPLNLAHIYDRLIVAGTNSELRECGALVPCHTYGPDEPDTRHVKKVAIGEDYSESQIRKMIMVQGIFGRVLDHYRRLNPDRRPAILFAPGVKESIWFAEQFTAAGIRAAHLDGANIWLDGELYPTSQELREQVLIGSKLGDIKILCNRFVLREGVDLPWLYHAILATVFGSLQSYLQAVGRLLRAHPSLDHVVLQDHGGNWHRHGSPNADREWSLALTDRIVAGIRAERLREKKDPEPIVCPKCHAVRLSGPTCHKCGHTHHGKSRMVVQSDGRLREYTGDIYKPHRISQAPDAQKQWDRLVNYRAPKAGHTFSQCEALFAMENNWAWPPRTLKNMPANELDWFRAVTDVPKERLR